MSCNTSLSDHSILQQFGGFSQNNLNDIAMPSDDADNEETTFPVSSYIATDKLCEIINSTDHNFSILSINIECLNSKYDSLLSIISDICSSGNGFSAICIQETWLSDNDDTDRFKIPTYNMIPQGKICSEHGGLAIFLKETYVSTPKNIYNRSNLWEGHFIDVSGGDLEKNIILETSTDLGLIIGITTNQYINFLMKSLLL